MRLTFVRFAVIVATLQFCCSSATAGIVQHSTMDNVDVGAGAGTDTSSAGPFAVRDTAGTPENGSAKDVINGGATASAHVTSGAVGQIGQALMFPTSTASNRGVTYGDVHDIGTGDYTVSLWFNADNTGGGAESIASKSNTGSSSEGWHIFVEGGNVYTRLGLGGGGALDRASMSDSASSGDWHHVAMVVDNSAGTVSGYLDGSLMSNLGGGGPSDNLFTAGSNIETSDELRLAVSAAGTIEFAGLLDDFAIYDQALSAANLGRIHGGGLAGLNAQQAFIPEPSSCVLSLLGLLGLSFGTRRRRRTA